MGEYPHHTEKSFFFQACAFCNCFIMAKDTTHHECMLSVYCVYMSVLQHIISRHENAYKFNIKRIVINMITALFRCTGTKNTHKVIETQHAACSLCKQGKSTSLVFFSSKFFLTQNSDTPAVHFLLVIGQVRGCIFCCCTESCGSFIVTCPATHSLCPSMSVLC